MIACALLAGVLGCGSKDSTVVVGPDGEKVTTDNKGNMTMDDGKGGRVDIQADGDKWTAKSSDGTQVDVTKEGMTSTNEKGEKFSMGTSSVSEADLGLPFYPGSEPISGRDMKSEADGQITYISFRSSSDPPAKVADFYKSKIESATTTVTDQMAAVSGKLKDGSETTASAIVNEGKTEISVVVSRKP